VYFTFAVLFVPATLVSKSDTVTLLAVKSTSSVFPAFLVIVTFPPVKSVASFKLYFTVVGAVTDIEPTVLLIVISYVVVTPEYSTFIFFC